jgi:hypothetical protein
LRAGNLPDGRVGIMTLVAPFSDLPEPPVLRCAVCCETRRVGNLLVLPDGRVGFIDFGIVGRISPVTWTAMEALLGSLAVGDYDTMARALATIGACR